MIAKILIYTVMRWYERYFLLDTLYVYSCLSDWLNVCLHAWKESIVEIEVQIEIEIDRYIYLVSVFSPVFIDRLTWYYMVFTSIYR